MGAIGVLTVLTCAICAGRAITALRRTTFNPLVPLAWRHLSPRRVKNQAGQHRVSPRDLRERPLRFKGAFRAARAGRRTGKAPPIATTVTQAAYRLSVAGRTFGNPDTLPAAGPAAFGPCRATAAPSSRRILGDRPDGGRRKPRAGCVALQEGPSLRCPDPEALQVRRQAPSVTAGQPQTVELSGTCTSAKTGLTAPLTRSQGHQSEGWPGPSAVRGRGHRIERAS